MPTKFVSRVAYWATTIYPGATAMAHRVRLWDALKAAIGLTDVDRVTITASRVLTIEDCGTLPVDASAGNIVLTLPASGVDANEALYEVNRLDVTSNTVTFAAAGADTVGGAADVAVLGTMRLRLPAGNTDWRVHSISGGTPAAARKAIGAPPRATRIDVASVAGTVDLTAVSPNTDDIRITGALVMTGFTIAEGRVVRFVASSASTLTNNANIVTNTGGNVVLADGVNGSLRAIAPNVVEVLNLSPLSRLKSATPRTVSGTEIDSTAIPPYAQRITMMFSAVSTNGISLQQVQIGDAGGVENTGYSSVAMTNGTTATSTTGFLINWRDDGANVTSGTLVLTRLDSATNLWVAQGGTSGSGGSPGGAPMLAGTKALSAVLDRGRLTTVNGVDVFDGSGLVNIMYE